MEKQQQNWHPISMLPVLATMISRQLEECKIQYENLLQAQHKPYILTDEIIERTIRVHKEQSDFILMYEKQLSKWCEEEFLPINIKADLAKSQEQLQDLNNILNAILSLANKLANGSIEKVMGKSDLELGMESFKKQT